MEAAPKHSGSDPTPTGAAIGAPVPFDLSRLALAQRDVALSSAWELERLGELLLQEATDDTPFVRTAALRVQALARVLGVTMEDIMGEPMPQVPEASPEDVAFFRAYAGMTEAEKDRVRQALKIIFPDKDLPESKR